MISGGQRLAETLVFSLANVGALVWARQTCKPCLTMFGIESTIQGLVESTCSVGIVGKYFQSRHCQTSLTCLTRSRQSRRQSNNNNNEERVKESADKEQGYIRWGLLSLLSAVFVLEVTYKVRIRAVNRTLRSFTRARRRPLLHTRACSC